MRRWISLITVMAGVSLVGFSGSLIKDTLHEDGGLTNVTALTTTLTDLDIPVAEPIKQP